MYRFFVVLPLWTFIVCIFIALPVYADVTTSTVRNSGDTSPKSFSSLVSQVFNSLDIDGIPSSGAKAFNIVSSVKEQDLDTEPADVFVPFSARQVQPSLPPVLQNRRFCTFPELFRRNTRQRAPRNARVFRRYRADPIVQFQMLYRVTNGVATVRITPRGRQRTLRRVGVSIRLGNFQLTRANQIRPRPFIGRNNAGRFRFERSFDYTGVSDIPRVSDFSSCCGSRLTFNIFIRMCQLVRRNRRRRGRVFREVCRTRLVQPRSSRLFCRRI